MIYILFGWNILQVQGGGKSSILVILPQQSPGLTFKLLRHLAIALLFLISAGTPFGVSCYSNPRPFAAVCFNGSNISCSRASLDLID